MDVWGAEITTAWTLQKLYHTVHVHNREIEQSGHYSRRVLSLHRLEWPADVWCLPLDSFSFSLGAHCSSWFVMNRKRTHICLVQNMMKMVNCNDRKSGFQFERSDHGIVGFTRREGGESECHDEHCVSIPIDSVSNISNWEPYVFLQLMYVRSLYSQLD